MRQTHEREPAEPEDENVAPLAFSSAPSPPLSSIPRRALGQTLHSPRVRRLWSLVPSILQRPWRANLSEYSSQLRSPFLASADNVPAPMIWVSRALGFGQHGRRRGQRVGGRHRVRHHLPSTVRRVRRRAVLLPGRHQARCWDGRLVHFGCLGTLRTTPAQRTFSVLYWRLTARAAIVALYRIYGAKRDRYVFLGHWSTTRCSFLYRSDGVSAVGRHTWTVSPEHLKQHMKVGGQANP